MDNLAPPIFYSFVLTVEYIMQRSPQEILARIDELIENCTVGPDYESYLDDTPHYSIDYAQFLKVKICNEHAYHLQQVATYQLSILEVGIVERAIELIEKNNLQTLRLCSIGCGDAVHETTALKKISEHFPDLTIQYTGIYKVLLF